MMKRVFLVLAVMASFGAPALLVSRPHTHALAFIAWNTAAIASVAISLLAQRFPGLRPVRVKA